MPCTDTENTPLPGDTENVLLRKLLNRLCNISSGGGGGGVSQAYVDARDAATLASANSFSSAGLAGKENVANKSTDGTFAANSDTLYPSQKAAKTYVDNAITVTAAGLFVLKAGDTMTGALRLPAGAVGATSLGRSTDTNSGLWFPADDTIAFSTAGVERVRIDSSGLVGNGVVGSVLSIANGSDLVSVANGNSDTIPFLSSTEVGGTFGWGLFDRGTEGNFQLNKKTGGAWTNALTVQRADGNVGIGIAVPAARLHVKPSASGTDYFRIDHSDGTPRLQVGALTGALTNGALWFGNITPDATNYGLANDGGTTFLNADTGGAINFSIAGASVFNMSSAGNLLWTPDNTYNIGAAGANRPANYFGAGTVNAAGGLITGNVASLVTSSAAMNDGAAAALGTLTNAPAAGNPTKWIPINDNGTTRYIPTW